MSRMVATLIIGLAIAAASQIAPAQQTGGPPPAAPPGPAPCAAAADVPRVAALYSAKEVPPTFQAAPQLRLPESAVAGALPATLGVGVDGSRFGDVWTSMTGWGPVVFLIMKGGNVFEVHGPVPTGEPSKKSKYFNLAPGPLSGHLRPDLVTAIHLVKLPSKEGFLRGALFYDERGDNVFGAFVGGEGAQPTAEQLAAFEKTWNQVKAMPQRCGKPAG